MGLSFTSVLVLVAAFDGFVGLLQFGDVEFLHLEGRLRDAGHLVFGATLHHLVQGLRHDLPGEAVPVLQPAALQRVGTDP